MSERNAEKVSSVSAGLPQIALRDAASGHPDLPDRVGLARSPARRVDDEDLVSALRTAAPYEWRRGRVLRRDIDDVVLT